MADGERKKTMLSWQAEAKFKEIRSLYYKDKKPLYTKEAIENLIKQIEEIGGQEGKTVTVQGLDGESVEFTLEKVMKTKDSKGHDAIQSAPFIDFVSFENLTNFNFNKAFNNAYCSLRVTNGTFPSLIPNDVLSVSEIEANFIKARSEWDSSKLCQFLKSKLDSIAAPRTSNVVAFSCGSMSGREGVNRRSAYQHAMILTLRDWVSRRESLPNVDCLAQDPVYQDNDRSVLQKVGINVLESAHTLETAKAFLKVEDTSVVVSISAGTPVRGVVMDIAKPAVLVWDGPMDVPPDSLPVDPDSPRVKEAMENQYTAFSLEEDFDMFERFPVCLYIRKA